MRLVARIAAIASALAALLVVSAVAIIYLNQQRIILGVLASVKQQTGIAIIPVSARVEIRNHLIVELDTPQVILGGLELGSLRRIRVVVNFHSVFTHGLPLHELELDGAEFTAPFDASAANHAPIPRPNRELIDQVLAGLGDLAAISRRLDINDLELRDETGLLLLHNASLVAYHRVATPKLWTIDVKADCEFPRLRGAHAAGDFQLGEGGSLAPNEVMHGKLGFRQLPLRNLTVGNIEINGESQGEVKVSLAHDATIEGVAAIGVHELVIRSPDLSSPLEPGDYQLEASFSTSTDKLTISDARLTHRGKSFMAAQGYIQRPYDADAHLAFGIAGLSFAWKDLLASIRALKRVPQEVEVLVRQMKSARVAVEKASLDAPLSALENLSLQSLLTKLSVNATLTELSFTPPVETNLPEVSGASAKIVFARQTLSLFQGSGNVGKSELHDVQARVDFGSGLDAIPYQLSMKAGLDLGELRSATLKILDQLKVDERDRIGALQGGLDVDLNASGTLRKNQPSRPETYLITLEPRSASVEFRGAPGPITLASGAMVLQPDVIKLQKVSARAVGGTADFDGELQLGEAGMQTRGLRIGMHQMPLDRWLEIAIDPKDLIATGNVGGEVIITRDPQKGTLANGKLTLQNGKIAWSVLRSPIFVHPAVLTIRDHTMAVSMPAAELEKSPIDFNITVADISHPSVRIDANVQKLDIEVLKFVRLPWTPPTPTHPPEFPISGHLVAREANLQAFTMKNAKTDFRYHNGDWGVDNLSANSMSGHLSLNIVGRPKDDWIRIFGRAQNMNVASLLQMSSKIKRSPVSGHLDATADLWADTDADFFSTMGGTVIVKLRDGDVDRFTLLSRLLELIDLRSWLTANVPDPRVSGLQFRTVSADFKGRDGVFYTDDLLLDGPVIDIVANGNVNLDRSTLDMKVGLIPFSTVTWLVGEIPLVGKNVEGSTKSIISAYFNVRGPITDPSVSPAPISTVAELLKKTLGLPINLIRPNTIK